MKTRTRTVVLLLALGASTMLVSLLPARPAAALNDWKVVGWNNLGMHCMDSDYSVFSLLPPFNTVCAQVVDQSGQLVDLPAGTTMTYRATPDPTGSINTTSAGKTNFWSHVAELYGAPIAVDEGLAGNDMPGPANVPQSMAFDAAQKWFTAVGIPIAPTDDAGRAQAYPLMRLEVRDPSGTVRGSTDIVLPVSSEMDCRACHASGGSPAAQPAAGWENDPDHERDYRLNILRLHDELSGGDSQYAEALAQFGLSRGGLYATVTVQHRSILCGSCHGTNALETPGFGTISKLTSAMHAGHANVQDPVTHMTLGSAQDRSACYRCHPGSETRCLRGAMGAAVAADGTLAMQCQSCHGDMARVGDPARVGWLQEPACQSCHTGSATVNNGQIRYDTVFEPGGAERIAVSTLFATNPDTPLPGTHLYRFSAGHGGLQCSACHGSTHAEYPSSHANDNLQSVALQGHGGMLLDCSTCHASTLFSRNGGPHGMHSIGNDWAREHADAVEHSGGPAQCQVCHGTNYRGTELSRSQGDRTITTQLGVKHFWDGYQVTCYDCHDGANTDDLNHDQPPSVANTSATTPAGVAVAIPLSVTDPEGDPTTLRIIAQPQNGTVSLSGTTATYFPFTGFAGTDSFTFAASDSEKQSELGTVGLAVTANWENFGEGLPGTLGVPELTLGGVPRLGASVPLHIGNSSAVATTVRILIGSRSGYQPSPFGGVILVADGGQRVIQVGPAGWHRPYRVTSDPQAIGRNVVMQTMVQDAGAPNGWAFSRGLRMVIGL